LEGTDAESIASEKYSYSPMALLVVASSLASLLDKPAGHQEDEEQKLDVDTIQWRRLYGCVCGSLLLIQDPRFDMPPYHNKVNAVLDLIRKHNH